MEVFLILILLVLSIIMIYQNNGSRSRLQNIEQELTRLRKEVSRTTFKEPVKEEIKKEPAKEVKIEKPTPLEWESGFTIIGDAGMASPSNMMHPDANLSTGALKEEVITTKKSSVQIPTSSLPQPSFLEKHPDLERFVGENLTNKIGIGILVLAIGFFVKYAIDNQWIGEVGRVAIGLFCGGILTALAHRMRNSYAGFSSVLLGGGLAIFYFTISLAYQEYHLFSQTVTFIIMVAITGFAVALSQLYNRQELAVIALIGGFATPFMASEGSGNYKSLFIYLIILNSGLLVISYFKTWRILNGLAFLFTIILFTSWLVTLPDNAPPVTFKHAFIFASIFYLLFIFINLAHNIKENRKFLASDFSIILLNTCLYFSVGIYAIDQLNAEVYRGLFTALLGSFNLLLSYLLFIKKRADPNILYLLIGITASLISLTAPIQLEGNNITLFWATETVLLYWLYRKSGLRIIQLASLFVWVALLISVFMDWIDFYATRNELHRIVFNKGVITMAFSSASCFALFHLRKKEQAHPMGNSFTFFPGPNSFFLTAVMILFAAGFSELYKQFTSRFEENDIRTLYLLAYLFAFILGFRWIVYRFVSLSVNKSLSTLLLIAGLIFSLASMASIFPIEIKMLITHKNLSHFIVHWLSALMVLMMIYHVINISRNTPDVIFRKAGIWLICSYIVFFISTELLLLVNLLFYDAGNSFEEVERIYVKTVLPILWGLCSFIFMWLGMKYKFRLLRMISLTLFTITLAKLFIFDIRNIPPGGKIAAFFCLGVLLLIISFMYQRVKKIITGDEQI